MKLLLQSDLFSFDPLGIRYSIRKEQMKLLVRLAKYRDALREFERFERAYKRKPGKIDPYLELDFKINKSYILRLKGDISRSFRLANKSIKFLDKLQIKDHPVKYHELKGRAYQNLGNILQYKCLFKKTLKAYNTALKSFKKNNFPDSLFPHYKTIGMLFKEMGDYKKAFEYVALSYDYFKKDKVKRMYIANNLGQILILTGRYDEAKEKFKETLKLAEKIGDLTSYLQALSNLGSTYYYKKNVQLTIKYFKLYYKEAQKIKHKLHQGRAANNLAVMYSSIKDYKTTLKYLKQYLKYSEEAGDFQEIVNGLNNIGITYAKLNQYEKTEAFLLRALRISKKYELKARIVRSLINLADYYIAIADKKSADKYFKKAREHIAKFPEDKINQGKFEVLKDSYRRKISQDLPT